VGARSLQRGAPSIVRLGLVGAGRWGFRIAETLRSLPGVELAAISSRHAPSFDRGGALWFERWQDLVGSGRCDGVVVASSPDTHVAIALGALDAGLAVMIEKPLALSLAEARRLANDVASRVAPAVVLVDHIHLFARAYEAMKSRLRSPVTEIRSYGCSFEPWRPYSSLFDYGPHDVSMVLDLAGRGADRTSCRLLHAIEREGQTHELFEIAMTLGDVHATSVVGNGAARKERLLEVSCANGDRLVYDDAQADDKLRVNGEPVPVPSDRPLARAITAFVRSMEGERDPRCGLALAMDVQTVLETCATSVALR
jgi:predicted dehydrogenase